MTATFERRGSESSQSVPLILFLTGAIVSSDDAAAVAMITLAFLKRPVTLGCHCLSVTVSSTSPCSAF
jgi:hypothetical protein